MIQPQFTQIAPDNHPNPQVDLEQPRLSVIHTVSWLTPDKGGPAYTVPSLADALHRNNYPQSIFSLGPHSNNTTAWGMDHRRPNDLENWGFLAKLGMSRSFRRDLIAKAHSASLIHAHGIWMLPAVYAAMAASQARIPLVISTHGMLDPVRLRISAGKKKLFHRLSQAGAMRSANCFCATADSERDHIRSFGIDAPVAIIPNGIHPPDADPLRLRNAPQRTVLSLGRIHPIKGLDRLITAWADIEKDFPDWNLRIVGPDELDHSQHLKNLAQSLNTRKVSIEHPVFGNEKWKLYESCDLFVLPTLSENFAITVAEALGSGMPVISTKGAPWQGLENNRCGWWINHGHDEMVATMRLAMSLDDTSRHRMGQRGRTWMINDFSWKTIAQTTALLYLWLLGRGDKPSCVDTAN